MRLVRSVTLGCGVILTLFLLTLDVSVHGGSLGFDGVVSIAGITLMALIGAFLSSRRPANAVGWLLLAAATLLHIQGSSADLARSDPNGDLAHAAAWLALWIWIPAVFLIGILLTVFPTGRPRTAFWAWVVRITALMIVLASAAAMPTIGASTLELLRAETPGSVPGGGFLELFATVLGILPVLAGLVALVMRYRRARGVERLQMKWFVFGATVLAGSILTNIAVAFVFGTSDPAGHPIGAIAQGIGLLAIPTSAAIAILRYQLYDIDRIISRTFSYAILTAVLTGTFALVVLLPPLVAGSGAADVPDYVVAVGTLVVATLFRPLRLRVQDAVDHRFNRKRYDAERTIGAFTTRMREQVDIDALGAELRTLVATTMQPTTVSLWFKGPG